MGSPDNTLHRLGRTPAQWLLPLRSPPHFPTFSPARSGFTVIELLIVIVIIGLIVSGVSIAWQKTTERLRGDIESAAVLGNMKMIKDAVVSGLYPDTGFLPCAEPTPASSGDAVRRTTEYAVRYLCLDPDCDGKSVANATFRDPNDRLYYIDCDQLPPKCREMCRFTSDTGDSPLAESFFWNKYYARGWRGAYMQCNSVYNARPENDGSAIFMPAMETPYVETCEGLAQDAETAGLGRLAEEYRRGKYYHIMGTTKNTLAVVSYGQDCLPSPAGAMRKCILERSSGNDCLGEFAYLQGCLETLNQCKQSCLVEEKRNIACTSNCMVEDYTKVCREEYPEEDQDESQKIKLCRQKKYKECIQCTEECRKAECFQRLQIADSKHRGYLDLEDDTVMFVFTEMIRSPLEKE
jgi:prepilin-type N-terminal cleavage/methylation domain-containing protein